MDSVEKRMVAWILFVSYSKWVLCWMQLLGSIIWLKTKTSSHTVTPSPWRYLCTKGVITFWGGATFEATQIWELCCVLCLNGAIPPLEECCWTLAILEGMPLKVSFAIERASTSKRKVVKIQPFYPRQKAWILLDGHHKVEAAARLGCSLNFLILGSWSNVWSILQPKLAGGGCFLWIKKIGTKK